MTVSSESITEDAQLLAPPGRSVRLDAETVTVPSLRIDYPQHPAYAPFAGDVPFGRRLRALGTFARLFALTMTKRLIDYELIPTHRSIRGSLISSVRWIFLALRFEQLGTSLVRTVLMKSSLLMFAFRTPTLSVMSTMVGVWQK